MRKLFFLFVLVALLHACRKDAQVMEAQGDVKPQQTVYTQTPYALKYPVLWAKFPMQVPAGNPMTVEGVALGRRLFYDPILSVNGTLSCSSCHDAAFAFTDHGKAFSDGAHGEKGKRNAMPLFNLGWGANFGPVNHQFFWDGGAANMESQVLGPIVNPIEMGESLPNVISKLKQHPEYPLLFKKAFGADSITTQLLAFAIAQFERTMISGNSKFDQGVLINFNNFTASERNGLEVFFNDKGGDCFHCHTITRSVGLNMATDFQFHNNGLQQIITDSGLARITGNMDDMGKFKTPSLRNLVFTAPYMHDGRFTTLEQVVDFYSEDAHSGANVDAFITVEPHPHGLNLSSSDKRDLIAFLKTLSDSTFVRNPDLTKP